MPGQVGKKYAPKALEQTDVSVSPTTYWEPDTYMTRRVKDKIKRAARATAQMLNGTWDWGDHFVPRHNDGSLRAPVADVLQAAGWARTSHTASKYLRTREFAEALSLEQMRQDGGFKQVLAEMTEGGNDLRKLSSSLWESLMEDLTDPDRRRRIPFKDKAKLYTEITALNAKVEGDASTRGGPGLNRSLETEFLEGLKENTDEVRFREIAVRLKQNIEEASETVEGIALLTEEE